MNGGIESVQALFHSINSICCLLLDEFPSTPPPAIEMCRTSPGSSNWNQNHEEKVAGTGTSTMRKKLF